MPSSQPNPAVVLVPGAWTGAWIWRDTVRYLETIGYAARTCTLDGLQPVSDIDHTGAVTLDDHVNQVMELVRDTRAARVVLVSHSYSGLVVGQVADRMPETVIHSIHLGSYLPVDGRSLLDDWTDDDETRMEEQEIIQYNDMRWAAPTREALAQDQGLSPGQQNRLVTLFQPHPGRTVLDPARMSRPINEQSLSYVRMSQAGASDPYRMLPDSVRDQGSQWPPPQWRGHVLESGHWPMVSVPQELHRLMGAELAAVTG